MKTVGILGGLGPQTSARFYLDVISLCKKSGMTERPPILMWNIPLSYEIEKRFITTGKGIEEYRTLLIEGAKILEKGGAEFVVIPCNSVHILINEVRSAVSIPVLSIIEETVNFLLKKNTIQIGILATTPTLQSCLYQIPLEQKNIQVYLPDKSDQSTLDDLIQKLAGGESIIEGQEILGSISQKLRKKGVTTILLACTDLQLLTVEDTKSCVYDTEKILVRSSVKLLSS